MNVGIDLEQISRFDLKKSEKIILNNFTDNEINYCYSKTQTAQHLCGIFCIKEDLFKSLDGEFSGITNLDFEVKHNPLKRPYISFINKEYIEKFEFDVSISHSGDYATAVVIKF